MGPLSIGPFYDELCGGVSVDRPVELVLHLCKKFFCGLSRGIVVQSGGVDVRDFLIEPPLGKADLANTLQQMVEVFFCENEATIFQPLIVQGSALDRVTLDDAVRTLAELHSAVIVDLEPDGDNHLQIVVHDFTADLTIAFGLNYSKFPNSCHFLQFIICKNLLNMFIDGVDFYIIELRHHFLSQPEVLVFIAHLNGILATASGGYKGQILRRRGTDGVNG